jgi:hypothetical protein
MYIVSCSQPYLSGSHVISMLSSDDSSSDVVGMLPVSTLERAIYHERLSTINM